MLNLMMGEINLSAVFLSRDIFLYSNELRNVETRESNEESLKWIIESKINLCNKSMGKSIFSSLLFFREERKMLQYLIKF